MRDYVIYDMYTDDRMFRYEVYKHPNGMYEVCVQSREAEDFAVNEQYLYCDILKKSHILPTPSKEL